MKTEFTAKQKEVIARKLGYDGPMQGFDEFLNSSPALQAKYNSVTDKYVQRMAKGGMVKKYQAGGVATNVQPGEVPEATNKGTERPMGTTFTDVGGVPQSPGATTVTPQMITAKEDEFVTTEVAPEKAAQVTAKTMDNVETVAAPSAITPNLVETKTAIGDVQKALDATSAAKGTVSDKALVTAEQGTVSDAAKATAVTGQAAQVVAPPARKVEEGELIAGPTVDAARVEDTLKKTQESAAQGEVTKEMTTQGQLDQLLTNFDAGSPPAWAAASMRAAAAALNARGLGASSLAGQAIIQATMEAAVPIAAADAQVYQQMGLQNLSNRQATAVLAAQQRAAFLGQEFDQAFETRVKNAAKIGEIANMNFTAEQQIALENARLTQQMEITNLTNEQAVIMANAATQASMDVANLNNRQMAAVANAKAFLDMDIKNLDNEQQMIMFKTKSITDALMSDAAQENLARQFNATSKNQTEQFMANLVNDVNKFNVLQRNTAEQFNIDQLNSINKFNTEQQNAREQFNVNARLVIDQANAAWRREISKENTAATNAANYLNAQQIQAVTLAEYNNEIQLYRDQVQMVFQAYENDENRIATLAAAQIAGKSAKDAAKIEKESSMWEAAGNFAAAVLL